MRPSDPWFALLAVCLSASALVAQPRLVKDINVATSPGSSLPRGVAIASLGNVTFFRAELPETGYELWKTDGTEGGTKLVRDIRSGPHSSMLDGVTGRIVGNRLVFLAVLNDSFERTLWATDGTFEGTVRLGDPLQFQAADPPVFGPVIGAVMYFTASTSATGRELWQTDGTSAGTRLAMDLVPGPASSGVRIYGQLGSRLLILATTDGVNTGLFTTDGTVEGTHPVVPSSFASAPGVTLGDRVLYLASQAGTGRSWGLMRTDGTTAGTTLVRAGFTLLSGFHVANGLAYFAAQDAANGFELWRTDGTPAGTSLVLDLTPGPADSSIVIHAVLGDRLLFTTVGDSGKLWSTDGTASGTRAVRDAKSLFSGAVVSGGFFYFTMADAIHGFELWKTDGTADGTSLVADIHPGPADSIVATQFPAYVSHGYFVPRSDGLFFTASNGAAGMEPWVTDGTAAGTRMVRNIMPDEKRGSSPRSFADAGGRLFFNAMSFLWTSDGTAEGTSRLEVSGLDPDPSVAVSSGGLYYFANRNRLGGNELWRTDGTVAGTFRLAGIGFPYEGGLTPFQGGLFFAGTDDPHGTEPWFTDGTVAGTRLLKDVYPGGNNGGNRGRAVVVDANTLLFPAESGEDSELWLTDGTPEGTRRLARREGFDWLEWPADLARFGDALFGLGTRRGEQTALWRIDAVSGQFTAVRRFDAQHQTVGPSVAGDAIVFVLGNELWRSDGTGAGTVRIREDFSPACFPYAVVGGGLLYWYASGSPWSELWRSAGTQSGTFRLGTVPGGAACRTASLHSSVGRLYFAGADVLHGVEPWVTDGTLLGTRRLWDVNPGPASSDPATFLRIGRTLFFSAEEPGAGRELWAMETACGEDDCPPRRRRVRR